MQPTKNTLLQFAQGNSINPKLQESIFSSTQNRNSNYFSPTLRCFNFFCQLTVRNRTDSTSIVGNFGQSVSKLDTTQLRTDRRATYNKQIGDRAGEMHLLSIYAKLNSSNSIQHLC